MLLVACRGCRRHIRASERTCPFCDVPPSRVPRGLVELGLAATATVGLAACYGAPSRYANHNQPSDREEHVFRMATTPGALARIEAAAPNIGCETTSPGGDNRRVLRCEKIKALIVETGGGLDVRCNGGTESECRALIDQLSSSVAPSPSSSAQ